MWWRRLRWFLTLIAMCPAAKRSCTAKNRAQEADDLLDYLADQVAKTVKETGRVPPAAAPLTPAATCCDQGGTCASDAKTRDTAAWHALNFTIDGAYRYQNEYVPDASGLSATLRAVGDLNCDTKTSLYEVEIHVRGTGITRTWHRTDPYE